MTDYMLLLSGAANRHDRSATRERWLHGSIQDVVSVKVKTPVAAERMGVPCTDEQRRGGPDALDLGRRVRLAPRDVPFADLAIACPRWTRS